jgi:hypothetical protein
MNRRWLVVPVVLAPALALLTGAGKDLGRAAPRERDGAA